MSGAARGRDWQPGEVIDGRYKVIKMAGEGGMGRVYQVRHLEWEIDLAAKQLLPDKLHVPGALEDFEREAEAWVSLGLHPNLCCCHYVRQLDGLPTAFAEYVPGGSLDDWIKNGGGQLYEGTPADVLRRLLDVAIQFAWGLDRAHQRGMVHQDVKPKNVLLDTPDGDISVKVTDFGLARVRQGTSLASSGCGADVSVRVPASGVMTLAYASPEQLAREAMSRRTDVYSYALSVFQMFTGKRLWHWKDDERLWQRGHEAGHALSVYLDGGAAEPGMPRMPRDLGALLQRCLHERPEDRETPENSGPSLMASIAEKIADIYHEVVHSPYPRTMPRAADLLADELNNRALSLLDLKGTAEAEATFAAALEAHPQHLEATYNGGLRQWRSGAITDDVLISRLDAARTAAGDSRLARYLLAEAHLERGDHAAAHELLRSIEHMASKEPGLANALQTSRSGQLADAGRVKTRTMSWHEYDGPGIPRIDIRLTGDGQRALVLSGRHLGLWDTRSGQCLVRLGGRQPPHAHIDISANGRFFLWGGGTMVGLWDLRNDCGMWRARTGADPDAEITAVSLSADASIAATVLSTAVASSDKNNVMIWNARTGRLLLRLGKHSGVMPVALSSDGRGVLTSGPDDRMARLWDTGTGSCVHELDMRELLQGDQGVSAMSISTDAKTASIAREDIGIWNLDTGSHIRTLAGHTRLVRSMSWSRDGRFLLSAADDDTVRLWEIDSGRCLRTFPSTRSWLWSTTAVLLVPDTGSPIVAEADTVRSWPLPSRYSAPSQLSRPRRHAELTRLDADAASRLDAAEQAIAAHQYSEAHGLLTEVRAIPGYERAPRVLSAWRSLAGVLPRVGVRASWQVREFDTQYQGRAVDLSPDGARAASGQLYTLHVWDTRTGRCLQSIDHPSMVTAAQLSPDQQRVATAAFCGQLGVWSIDTGDCLMKVTRQQNNKAHWTHFSADGRWALSNTYDSIRLWDLNSGQCVRTVTCDAPFNAAVSLSPDGGRAVTSLDDYTVRVWEMGTGNCLHTLTGHASRIGALSLSPAGDLAVSSDDQRTMRLWDLASGACMHVLRDLPDRIWSVRFVCDGRFVMTGSTEGTIQIWNPRTGQCLHTFNSGRTEVTIAPTQDGRFALSHGGDVPLRLWEFDWELATSST